MDLEDWDSGEVITLALDPDKTCIEQAEALYRKARKQERAAAQLSPLLDAAQEQVRTCPGNAMRILHRQYLPELA